MKLKNVKSQSAKVLAKVSLKVGKMSANSFLTRLEYKLKAKNRMNAAEWCCESSIVLRHLYYFI